MKERLECYVSIKFETKELKGKFVAASEKSAGVVGKSTLFAKESWAELKKVHSPTRQETIQATIVVLVMVVIFSMFLGLADFVVGLMMKNILT